MFAKDYQPNVAIYQTNPYNTDQATADTIRLMQEIVQAYANHPLVVSAAQQAKAMVSNPMSVRELCRGVYYWVKSHLKFVSDEYLIMNGLHRNINQYGSDLLITPDALLSMPIPQGDCDDYSMLGASMLASLGIPSKFVTVAANKDEPDTFSHVYTVVYLPSGERLPLDFSHGTCPGWEYKGSTRIQEW